MKNKTYSLQMLEFPKCPICKQDIASDANAKKYCKLCGMITKQGKFCCWTCRNKFNQIKNTRKNKN